MNSVQALVLIIAANASAWAAGRLLGNRWSIPLDLGIVLPDGERMLGSHKTWRGLISGAVASSLAAGLLGFDMWLGFAFGILALLGDAASSALKRRMHWPPGKEAPLIDQLPESLLPLLLLSKPLNLDAGAIVVSVTLFIAVDLVTTRFRKSAPHQS